MVRAASPGRPNPLKADQMSDIFNEIDEDIRREQLHTLWRS